MIDSPAAVPPLKTDDERTESAAVKQREVPAGKNDPTAPVKREGSLLDTKV